MHHALLNILVLEKLRLQLFNFCVHIRQDICEAVRSLADCLEYLRKDIEKVIAKKDDADLFNIANNFGIRHHNDKQKTNYESAIWLSWMFYFYLATIHACIRLINKKTDK